MASMIADLLKTPAQVRMEQQGALREQGRKAAASLTSMPISGARSAIPSLVQNLAASTAADIPLMAEQLKRSGMLGLGGVAQLAGRGDVQSALQQAALSPEERQAQQLNKISGALTSKDPAEIRQAAAKAEEAGRPDIAAQLLKTADEVEQTADKNTSKIALFKMLEDSDPIVAEAFRIGELTFDQARKAIQDPELKEIQNYVVDGEEFLGGMRGNDLVNVSTGEVVKGNALQSSQAGTRSEAYAAPSKYTKPELEAAFDVLDEDTMSDLEAMASTDSLLDTVAQTFGIQRTGSETDEQRFEYIKTEIMRRANELRKQGSDYDTPEKAIKAAINEMQGAPMGANTPQGDSYANVKG